MITDARALRPSYLPADLHHRDGKIDQLADALRPITDGDIGEDAFIFGPSGTGKTTLAKYVVRKLEQEALDLRWGYVNCMSGSSKNDVLHGLVRDAGLGADLRKEGTSTTKFLDRLREFDDQVVAILDEVDVLEDESTLHSLYDLPNLTLVLITIDEDDLFAHFDGRLRSRFMGSEMVRLERYRHEELCDILRARIKAGLAPGVIDERTVEYIADIAAGDARVGIAILRRATKRIMNEDESWISLDVVDSVQDEAREEIHQHHVDDLGTHKRLLYEIVEAAGEIGVTELHETYEQRAPEPKAKSTRRRYLASLESKYNLIASSGNGKGKSYTVPDF
ncbi:Cdc6/Cdc18 family protein [Natronoglomus mannanivorans]|uniref:Orc1/cdc6 family replication initiation protein n=1 Tax=Natronoglomus mannanivorans TaxID=2979990 RepID=A0AAP2Z2Z6_9EURY|nr:orc1/cdc6 family replication initiation protein [Halobacteria archaeon AArc-xg1-1]